MNVTILGIAEIVTVLSVICSAVWGIATMRQMTVSIKESVGRLTESVNKLADRIDDLEHEHADTRERIARIEASRQQQPE